MTAVVGVAHAFTRAAFNKAAKARWTSVFSAEAYDARAKSYLEQIHEDALAEDLEGVSAADLAARCHRAAIEGRWSTTMRFFAGPTLLVIDELGYLPLPAQVASALFQVVAQRYLKTSIVITTNRSVAEWGEVLGDTTVAAAMLDRLLHRSVVLKLDGDSYRLRDHHARTQNQRTATAPTRRSLQ